MAVYVILVMHPDDAGLPTRPKVLFGGRYFRSRAAAEMFAESRRQTGDFIDGWAVVKLLPEETGIA